MEYKTLASAERLDKTAKSLSEKGYFVSVVNNGKEALEKIKEIVPSGADVMNGSSVSLKEIGFIDLLQSGMSDWNDLHAKITAESDKEKRQELRKMATLSEYYLGSVHAVTEDGQMVVASNSGSQLPHVVYTSPNLVFVVGTQKLVANLDEGIKRVEEYVYPLEDQQMMKLYNSRSGISKIVIFRKESASSKRRINIILVKEVLGF